MAAIRFIDHVLSKLPFKTKKVQTDNGSEFDQSFRCRPPLMISFLSGTAPVHDRSRLPKEYEGAPNGQEGAHHFPGDDFVRAVTTATRPPVSLEGLSIRGALPGGVRGGSESLRIPDFGEGTSIERR
jgi:hypothetical protein